MNGRCIYNANIVLQDKVIYGYIVLKNGKIEAICEGSLVEKDYKKYEKQDAAGMYILPGVIDINNSYLESKVSAVMLGAEECAMLKQVLNELERKLSLSGITTVYHSIDYGILSTDSNEKRGTGLVDEITRRKGIRHMLNHRINLKYDLSNKEDLCKIIELIQSGSIHLITFAQKPNIDFELALAEKFNGKRQKGQRINLSHVLQHSQANRVGIAVQSVDDSYIMPAVTCNKQLIRECDSSVCVKDKLFEFQSVSGLLAQIMIENKLISETLDDRVIYKDDETIALIPSIFKLGKRLDNLSKAVALVTINVARAVGVDRYLGSIEEGKIADLVMVEIYDNIPQVRETYLNGRRVIACDYFE